MDRTVTTQGSGRAAAVPDATEVVLVVDVEGATPAEALRSCGELQTAVVAALGVAVSSGGVSVTPGWDQERQRPGRPHAVSTLTARLPLASAGDAVTAALEAGGRGVQLQSLTAVVTDTAAARAEARAAAFAAARDAAEQHAALAGGRLGRVLSVSEGAAPPSYRASKSVAFEAALDVPGGALDVGTSVVASWELLDG